MTALLTTQNRLSWFQHTKNSLVNAVATLFLGPANTYTSDTPVPSAPASSREPAKLDRFA